MIGQNKNSLGAIIFFVYLIFGLFLLNDAIKIIEIIPLSPTLTIITGALLILGGLKFLKLNGHNNYAY